ncbi:MAG TPA: MMPL family transporter, partial [Burkholderiales bacterium]|nr:MMPL family transporter [Burkholderiales bacterium]
RLAQAVQGLPVRAQVFAPFLENVEAARQQRLLQASDLEKTSMAMAIDALLIAQDGQWKVLMPLTPPAGGTINAGRIRAELSAASLPNVLFVDTKAESDHLYAGYLHEAVLLSLGGLLALIVLLLWALRSPLRVLRVIAPMVAAVITVTAGLALLGQQLTILHLVGLLLVVAVGSNYALFFDRPEPASSPGKPAVAAVPISPRTLASMMLANLTTVAGFGLLAFSNVSILQAMGSTVAPGVVLALIYAGIFARKTHA